QLGEGLRTIESEAFYWCASLTSVWLPASLEYMAADAFSLCDLVHLYVPAGSYAESWAQQQGIPHTSL
ncbi:MAG: leucine-rich repeat protein, partial [Clostridiales bacterium]|nr:leucine-rich repeat protein [Clostridiales bacterium]